MTTPQHIPSGNYPAHAASHVLDIETTADRLLAELPGHGRRAETLAREGGVSIVMMAMEAGDAIEEHSAPGPVSVHLLRGQVQVTANGDTAQIGPGQVVFMQPNVRHSVEADTQAVVLLTVSGGGTPSAGH
jgi:quercetin dioxygenase-like cupin family protein